MWPRVQQFRQFGPPQPSTRGKGPDKVRRLEVALGRCCGEDGIRSRVGQHDVAKLLNLIGGQETQDLASFPCRHGGLAVRGAQAPLVQLNRLSPIDSEASS